MPIIDQQMPVRDQILSMCRQAKAAARQVVAMDSSVRADVVQAMAVGIEAGQDAILAANAEDVAAGRSAGLSDAMLDRLALSGSRIAEMAAALRQVAKLPDGLGEVLATLDRENGLIIQKVRVPLGVIGMVYESRPNVTADAAALCFRAGSAVILRGGSEASRSNAAIHRALCEAGERVGLPEHAIQLVPTTDRAAVHALLQMDEYVDLIIPRGGESLIRAVAEQSRVPVLKHYKGVCHVYVDAGADLDMAREIIINAKCQRPGVCNAAETLLVHQDIAKPFLSHVGPELIEQGVEIRGDERTCALLPGAAAASEEDWSTEYLDLRLSVRIVPDLASAIDHIETYGTHHSDAIVTNDDAAAERFLREVDSAAVYHNASTRFTDGSQFGMGAEIGISTDKLHARGPCGIQELTTYKYVVRGTGQVRG